jgi:hypothetical protein
MVANGLRDHQDGGYWCYRIDRTADGQSKSEFEVETPEGPVHRVLAINGHPLTPSQQKAEDARLKHLLEDPSIQEKVKEQHLEDETRLIRLTKMLTDGFLYDFDSASPEAIRLRFRPNPAFVPPSYEARVFHALTGTITVDRQETRMREMHGHLFEDVEFGYGLLGRVDKGGTFLIAREPVSPQHWKTYRVDVQVTGHFVLFRSVSRNQKETRWDFRRVPPNLTLRQAVDLVNAHARGQAGAPLPAVLP